MNRVRDWAVELEKILWQEVAYNFFSEMRVRNMEVEFLKLSDAINSFRWVGSTKGWNYWNTIYNKIVQMEENTFSSSFIYTTSPPKCKYKYKTYKDYNTYKYKTYVRQRFKVEDYVLYKNEIPWKIIYWNAREKTYYISLIWEKPLYTKEHFLSFNLTQMKKTKLYWIDVVIEWDTHNISVRAEWFSSFNSSYTWKPLQWYERNKRIVYEWFENQIEKEANRIAKRLENAFNEARESLETLVFEETKELLMASIFDTIEKGVKKQASSFKSPKIAKTILNLFSK